MHQKFVFIISTVPPVKYHFVLTVNQTAGRVDTRKTEFMLDTYALYCVSFSYSWTQ